MINYIELAMKKIIILICVFLSYNIYSQEYFQQEVNYIINVTLNDGPHTLDGFVDIDYTNNSNENLDILWFHLWPNAYRNNTTALAKQKLENGDIGDCIGKLVGKNNKPHFYNV